MAKNGLLGPTGKFICRLSMFACPQISKWVNHEHIHTDTDTHRYTRPHTGTHTQNGQTHTGTHTHSLKIVSELVLFNPGDKQTKFN